MSLGDHGGQGYLNHHGLHIRVSVSGDGDPLLLIMGLGGNLDMWEPLASRLQGRRLISFDAPGTGQSSTPWTPVALSELATLSAVILDRLSIERADVLGFSYGGLIAQELAHSHSSRVRRLVLAATTCGVGSQHGRPDAVAELLTPWRYFLPSHFHRTAKQVYGGVVGENAQIREELLGSRTGNPPSPYGYMLQLLAGAQWSSLSFLGQLEQPALVLSGDDDPLVPVANAQMLAEALPNARLEIQRGSGHLLLLDEPARSAQAIHAFLTEKRAREEQSHERIP